MTGHTPPPTPRGAVQTPPPRPRTPQTPPPRPRTPQTPPQTPPPRRQPKSPPPVTGASRSVLTPRYAGNGAPNPHEHTTPLNGVHGDSLASLTVGKPLPYNIVKCILNQLGRSDKVYTVQILRTDPDPQNPDPQRLVPGQTITNGTYQAIVINKKYDPLENAKLYVRNKEITSDERGLVEFESPDSTPNFWDTIQDYADRYMADQDALLATLQQDIRELEGPELPGPPPAGQDLLLADWRLALGQVHFQN